MTIELLMVDVAPVDLARLYIANPDDVRIPHPLRALLEPAPHPAVVAETVLCKSGFKSRIPHCVQEPAHC